MTDASVLFWIIVGYITGGIPFGWLIARAKGYDIRYIGSKSIGATNAGRIAGKLVGYVTMIADILKSAVPAYLCWYFTQSHWLPAVVGLVAVLTHCIQPFLEDAKGKGASTLLGVALVLNWHVAIIVYIVHKVVVKLTGYVSVGTIAAAIFAAVTLSCLDLHPIAKIAFVLAALITIFQHRENISRLWKGEEPKVQPSEKKAKAPEFPEGVIRGLFLIHQTKDDPHDTKDKLSKSLWILKFLPAGFIHRFILPNLPVSKLLLGWIVVEANNGQRAGLEFHAIPFLARQMIAWAERALERMRIIIRLAIIRGAVMCGLGAYNSIIGNGGRTISEEFKREIGMTTGSSYTTGIGVRGGLKLAREVGHDPKKCKATVIGATGAIGRVAAEMLAGEVDVVYLVGRDIEDQRLIDLANKIVSAGGKAIIANIDEALIESEIVISVTSATGELDINPRLLRRGAIVVDLARPRDFGKHVIKTRSDEVIIIDGGIVRVPKLIGQSWSFGYEYGYIYACMAETLILMLKGFGKGQAYSIDVTAESVQQLLEWGDELGFVIDGYRCLDIPLSPLRLQQHAAIVQEVLLLSADIR
jgi:fatty aldehyde-generating acyl-ACP reductase